MAEIVLPFEYSYDQYRAPDDAFLQTLPAELRTICETSTFLTDYIRQLPIELIGVPDFYPKPPRSLGDSESPNLIYPIKEGLFVHIYPDNTGFRHHHVAIEPTTVINVDDLVRQIDERLVDWAEDIGRTEDKEEKRALLIELIDRICTTKKEPTNGSKRGPTKIFLTPRELEAARYRILRDKIGLGVLQPLLLDSNIEDISCSGVGHIFIEHKIFKSVRSTITFVDHDDVDAFAVWLGEWIKHPVTVRNPLVDAVLPDGSRINIVYGREISKRGSNFTIRKFSGTPVSVFELVEYGSLNYMMASYLSLMLEAGMNTFVVGATASGKTTLLNAITTFIRPEAKIVTIEDTPEVQVPHHNWVQESTRLSGGDKGSDVGMFELLKAALRQRPEMIIVGEIRSMEAVVAFQAMQTGHGVMSTFHAATVEKLIQRLTGDPINIPKTYIDNLNLAVIQSAVRLADGRSARRVLSINEIIGYDPVTESFSFLEAFRWNPATDQFEFPGYMNSYLLEQIIAIKRGIPPHQRKRIYDEVKRRAKIFEKLHKEKGVTDFYDLFSILAEARRQKLV
jgi:flagellar protein FlaI